MKIEGNVLNSISNPFSQYGPTEKINGMMSLSESLLDNGTKYRMISLTKHTWKDSSRT